MRVNLLVWLVVQDEQGRVLLGRRNGSAYGHGLWGLPGGTVEDAEGLPEAAARELHEEMGLTVPPESLRVLGVRRYQVDGVRGTDFLFSTPNWQGQPTPLHKTSEVGWFTLDNLPSDILPWIPAVLHTHLTLHAPVSEQLEDVTLVRPLH